MFINNFEALAVTPQRKIVLNLIETALSSIQSENVIGKSITVSDNTLTIKDKTFDLSSFNRVFLIGFGKGSAKNSKLIEEKLGEKLTEGYVIDTNPEDFKKIKFTKGTHPLPSEQNLIFTKFLLKDELRDLSEKDLFIVVITGGGSALFENPYRVTLDKLISIEEQLLKSGADIFEMNTVRKHLSLLKGGGLLKYLYPAKVISIISSDVPGNDLSVISSGPTVRDNTTVEDALNIVDKYRLRDIARDDLTQTPKEDKYFERVSNILILSNVTALETMKQKAQELGITASIYSDKFQGLARTVGKELIESTMSNSILLAGGETTVRVTGNGEGGRNQEVVLSALLNIDDKTVISSFDSDGWDNSPFAGAIGDTKTLEKAKELGLNPAEFLNSNNSLAFFQKVGDGIETGRLPSNVSDLMIVMKV
ncbi:MAG: hypothetical protein A3H50_02555 [Candidatus Levybacteria bacterium RIFCSPLOWO2_02_FULL_37_10]|nr:MAG: hypothetical protein A2860_01575 [Candidatus Levybacteria bacterium RIFCSPHIGHO2_01_FULL_37_33]OGH17338.1 MAG: hypothetical protein A3C97_03615 [Candidatus Levybacteria bacterium RIFCSPHIGHO2_02_FULL_37_11]OGH33056.1 MAG: hypothetical protein A2953_00540 [Candidatus Levybacteria bacterium RIFCSPLOWO2_01_FULL_36_54]OGH43213.1 MAG: hypothetical protein A3H50_02555 [Candidatus Levybacteria bacterium RIFCSPLOWO2_02_FULL_37_10]